MFSNLKALVVLLIITTFTLSGCGDLSGSKVIKRKLTSSQFEVQCELDMDKFSQIMSENISSQIRCLGENLNLFIKVVKSGKPGYLSRVQLEQYLANHRPDVKPEVVRGLKAVFDLGHLITGEDSEYISKTTVDKVIDFALIFNQEAALNFGPIFQNESPVTYALHQNHRDRVSGANKAIIQALRTIFNPDRNGQIHRLNIIELIESFSTETNRPDIEKAKKVLFLKKVLLGGENEIITHNELEKLILNFDHLLLIGLDIVRYKYIILKQDSILQLLRRDVDDQYDMVTQGTLNDRDNETLFTMNESIEAAKIFIDRDNFDIEKFRNLIGEAKKIIMKGNSSEVRGGELKALFQHAKTLLKTGTVFHRIYDKFKAQLESPRPVEDTINFDEYRHTYPEHQAELEQFERITKKYRFMKGEFLSAYYTRGFKRNADAVFEVALFEYALKLVFATYGSPSPNTNSVGGYSIDKEQMQKLILKFEKELIELDLIYPQRAIGTADNISLLGTLFQYQSDTNKVMDVNEATEFGVTLVSSINVADDLFGYMKDENCSMDQFDRVQPSCFRKSFWKGLCSYYRSYYPLMFQSLNGPKKCEDFDNTPESAALLDRAINAARTCTYYTDGLKEEIPYSKSDFMTIMVALMHAETTILRWDVNNNNYMDEDEVNRAYEIYSPALDGFLQDKSPYIKSFKKQIYQYLVKYEQVPDEKDFGSIWKFVKFLLSFNKKAPATRKTIVSILNVIGDQNKMLQSGPPFNCNLLRDPENIPHEVKSRITLDINLPSPALPNSNEKIAIEETAELIHTLRVGEQAQLKAELADFSDDMIAGRVNTLAEVRQPGLKSLFIAIASDENQMRSINSKIKDGSELHKIAFAVSAVLLAQ